ncbi:MAG: TorF family putative porin [Pseudomonadota bacterium]
MLKSLFAVGAVAAFASANVAAAQEDDGTFFGGTFSGNVAITSDYVFRGISQTGGDPTVQGGFDWASDDFYAGIWASGVDFGDGTSAEIDFYGGWTPSLGDIDLNFGVLYYFYPAAPQDPQQNYVELIAGGSTTVLDFLDVGLTFFYSPDYYFESGDTLYINGTVGFPLISEVELDGRPFSLAFHASGNHTQFFQDDTAAIAGFEDYIDYGAGFTASYLGFDLDVSYVATSGFAGLNDDTAVVTLSRSL